VPLVAELGRVADHGGELLDEQGHALSPVVQRRRGRRARRPAEDALGQCGRTLGAERRHLHLVHAPGPPERHPQSAQRVRTRDLVAAKGADEQDALVLEVGGEPGQEVDRGAVGPLHVVEEDRSRLLLAECGEPARDGLEQCGPGDGAGIGRQLREQESELGRVERRPVPHVGPDEPRDRCVRLPRLLRRLGREHAELRVVEGRAHELRLAAARLAADQDDAAPPGGRVLEQAPEPVELLVTLEEVDRRAHGSVYDARGRRLQRRRRPLGRRAQWPWPQASGSGSSSRNGAPG
jgi:hypothetical protein